MFPSQLLENYYNFFKIKKKPRGKGWLTSQLPSRKTKNYISLFILFLEWKKNLMI